MKVLATRPVGSTTERGGNPSAARILRPVGRFVLHLAEMCIVMCVSAVVLSVAFFAGAGLLGYDDLPRTAPELSVLVIAVNLSVPMLVWMRLRGMSWQPTLEMSGSTMTIGLLLIAASWMNLVPPDNLIGIQTSLACPVMLAVMLLRFPLYSAAHSRHAASTVHT
jgi:hypothetical protein